MWFVWGLPLFYCKFTRTRDQFESRFGGASATYRPSGREEATINRHPRMHRCADTACAHDTGCVCIEYNPSITLTRHNIKAMPILELGPNTSALRTAGPGYGSYPNAVHGYATHLPQTQARHSPVKIPV